MNFKDKWKQLNSFEKSNALTKSELEFVRSVIGEKQRKGWISSRTIKYLQQSVPKLSLKYRAETAYWTEVKHQDTKLIAESGDDMGIEDYKVILSPDACKLCREKTQEGRKVFKSSEVQKAGIGHVPPFHPNCYCVLIPTISKK